MYIWQFIIFIVLWFPIEYLCIHLEVKQNPDLFYALHEKEKIKTLHKLKKKDEKKLFTFLNFYVIFIIKEDKKMK